MKKGAIFDQDGLMFDTEALFSKAWLAAGDRLGVAVPSEFCTAVSGSSGESMRRIVKSYIPNVDCDEFIRLAYQICYEMQSRDLPEKPGLREILAFFKANGVKMAVASSSHRHQVQANLQRSGIGTFFDAVVAKEDVSQGKPDPEIFLTAAKQLGLAPSDCYVFEDSFNGVRAGHAAGCCTIMIPDLREPDEEIAALYDACFPDLLTVIGYISTDMI